MLGLSAKNINIITILPEKSADVKRHITYNTHALSIKIQQNWRLIDCMPFCAIMLVLYDLVECVRKVS